MDHQRSKLFVFTNIIFKTLISILIWIPLLLIIFLSLLCRVYRCTITPYLKWKYGQRLQFVSDNDSLCTAGRIEDCVDINTYNTITGSGNLTVLRNRVRKIWLEPQNSDGSWVHEKLRMRLCRDMGYSFWIPVSELIIEDHVIKYDGPKPKNKEELNQLFGELCCKPLPANLPLWKCIILDLDENFPEFDSGPHHIIHFRVSHVVFDGLNALRATSALCDDQHVPVCLRHHRTSLQSFWTKLLLILEFLFITPFVLVKNRLTIGRNVLNNYQSLCGGSELVGFSNPISLHRVKRVKNLLSGTTVNDVVMSCIAGGMRAHFLAEKQEVPEMLQTFLSMSLDDDFNKPLSFENNFVVVVLRMPLGEKGPLERLMATKKECRLAIRKCTVYLCQLLIFKIIGVFPHRILSWFILSYGSPATVTSLKALDRQVFFNKQEVIRSIGLIPTLRRAGLTVVGVSMEDKMQFGVRADGAVFKNPKVMDRFLININKEFEDLENALQSSKMYGEENEIPSTSSPLLYNKDHR